MREANSIYPRCPRSAVNMITFSKYMLSLCILSCAGSLSHVAGFAPYSHPSTHLTSGAGVLTKGNTVHSSCTIKLNQSSTTGEEFDMRPVNKKNTLSTLSDNYKQLTTDHYLLMAFLQAGFLASGADIATQTMESNPIDFSHVAAMATVASTFSGEWSLDLSLDWISSRLRIWVVWLYYCLWSVYELCRTIPME